MILSFKSPKILRVLPKSTSQGGDAYCFATYLLVQKLRPCRPSGTKLLSVLNWTQLDTSLDVPLLRKQTGGRDEVLGGLQGEFKNVTKGHIPNMLKDS